MREERVGDDLPDRDRTPGLGGLRRANTDNALRLHLVPALGARSMAAIRRNDIQVLFKHLSDQLGPGSVRNVYDVLVRVMTAAVDDKDIASSPCRRITLPAMPDEEVTPPTVEQVEAMARVMPPYIRAAIVTPTSDTFRPSSSPMRSPDPARGAAASRRGWCRP
ncbi:hypothetical protein [Streptomyces sp. CoH17]|uniref:hypothetical protein n=1 Tax=Streptomyces sp. CoH17 TaxID=2992806 RepID=UPI00226F565C